MRFISHHDLMRLFERAVRRADIPVSMSQGFNPRPKMSLPAALALGIEGADEIIELGLSRWLAPEKLQEYLNLQLPSGLAITSAEPVAPQSPSRVNVLEYQIEADVPEELTQKKLDRFLAEKKFQVLREKKGGKRSVDLRSSIVSVSLEDGILRLSLRPTGDGMARPDEVLKALGIEAQKIHRITRCAVHLSPSQKGD